MTFERKRKTVWHYICPDCGKELWSFEEQQIRANAQMHEMTHEEKPNES